MYSVVGNYCKRKTTMLETTQRNSFEFEYMLLDRCREDCRYFLGNGFGYEKNLWGGDVSNHIKKMRELYNTVNPKPEWITLEEINDYEERMNGLLINRALYFIFTKTLHGLKWMNHYSEWYSV